MDSSKILKYVDVNEDYMVIILDSYKFYGAKFIKIKNIYYEIIYEKPDKDYCVLLLKKVTKEDRSDNPVKTIVYEETYCMCPSCRYELSNNDLYECPQCLQKLKEI